MADVAKKYQDNLKSIKNNIENSYEYFKPNCVRFNEYRRMVFESSISDGERAALDELKKPILEFNILEAYISRLRGEFSKQEPSISVRAADGTNNIDSRVISLVEDHLRAIFFDANNDSMEYDIYTDTLSGGFSVAKVYTDYANEMSFQQNIYVRRAFDPTLCGFDPLARTSHKGDGRYCFEIFPKTKEEFEEEYGSELTAQMKFTRNQEGFSWTYRSGEEDIVLICDYYEKKKKRTKIVQLVTGQVMTYDAYQAKVKHWNDAGIIAQPPAIMGKPRFSDIQTICRYRVVENKVLEYVETDYNNLPLVFFDGNSAMIRRGGDSAVQQLTRPYVYHAKGIQRLKNFAGQTLANELENMGSARLLASIESIPPQYLEGYVNPDSVRTLIYNAFKDNDPNVPLNPPIPLPRIPIPPEITNTFTVSDQVTQAILGNFDMDLGHIPSNAMSGIAIQESATMSNSAAMPYIVGFLKGLNQMANIIVDLIPKYYVTPRTIPVLGKDGKRSYQMVNAQGGVSLSYQSTALEVKVEAGVNFQIQKSRALQQVIALMQASPMFAQFMNTEGLPVLLDNVEIRGIDQLKQLAEQWMQQQKQMQQQMQQQGAMQNPMMMKMQLEQQKLQQTAQKNQMDAQFQMAELQQGQQEIENDRLKIYADMTQAQMDAAVQSQKANAERSRNEVDLAMKHQDMLHSHSMDLGNHVLDVSKHIHDITMDKVNNGHRESLS